MLEDTKITVALITSAAAIVGCIANGIFARSNQRKMLEIQDENNDKKMRVQELIEKKLQEFKAKLDEKKSEKDARRDYEYEALRRLYKECSPILFQLSESAAAAFDRIKSLARSAANGKLEDPDNSWLSEKEYRYYLSSTEYRILAPLAYFTILRERITHLDMALDPEIQAFYVLARQGVRVLSEDFKMAENFSHKISYAPNIIEENPNDVVSQKKNRQQGIPRGIVESALEAMVERGSDDSYRIISFAKYDEIFRGEHEGKGGGFKRLRYFFSNFHPRERPVTWRILITEALIFRAIEKLSTLKADKQKIKNAEELFSSSDNDFELFNWHSKNESGIDDSEINAAISVAKEYLVKNLYSDLNRALE